MQQHRPNGAVVVIALHSPRHILLVKNVLRQDALWKFAAETVEPSEPVLNSLVAGAREELGFEIPVKKDGGKVIEAGNETVKVIRIGEPRFVGGRTPHTRHFYRVEVSDHVLLSLSGKELQADADEKMLTRAFGFFEPENMPDFLPPHKNLYTELKYAV